MKGRVTRGRRILDMLRGLKTTTGRRSGSVECKKMKEDKDLLFYNSRKPEGEEEEDNSDEKL